ncbi:SWI/SNF chromatin-remodeling complex subunit SNF5 [Leucoagaricus sp. SymC.cos]|nr:SWI/SNF chromatin-remodeling complex subunit SNF5 [Leucoagaricus sp. SymC.cos]
MSNPNLYTSQSFASGSNPNPAGINPAMLAAGFQNGPVGHHQQQQPKFPPNAFGGGAVSPAQLMGAGGAGMNMGMNMNAMNPNAMNTGGVNPTQLLQQQQQQHGMMNGSMGGMGGSMNMNMMSMNPNAMGMAGMTGMGPAGGINPAALSGNSGFNPMAQSQQHPSLHQGAQPQMQQPQQPQQQPQQQPPLTPQQQMVLGALGMTREQFNSLTQQEKQHAWMKVMQFPGSGGTNPTPTTGGSQQQQQQMMPPPAPPQSSGGPISVPGRLPTSQGHAPGQGMQQRPPTAQGQQQRPPTAQGHQRPPTAQGIHIGRPPTAQGMQRPPTAQGHRVVSGPGPGSTPQTPNPSAATLSTMGDMQMQPRPPTTQGGQQTRPPTAQGMLQTPAGAARSHAGQPGTRPGTAQSGVIGQQISRPGTALSHRSPVSAGSAHAQSPGAVRPPSRAAGADQQPFGINGFPKHTSQQQQGQIPQGPNPYPSSTPQQPPQTPFAQKSQAQQQGAQGQSSGQFGVFGSMNPPITPQNQTAAGMMQQQQNSAQQTPQMMQGAGGGQATSPFGSNFPGGGQHGSPPPMSMPDSPYRGAKRTIDSPSMGGMNAMNMNAMGGMNQMNMNAMGMNQMNMGNAMNHMNQMSPMGPPSMMPNRMSMSGPSGGPGSGGGTDVTMNGVSGASVQKGGGSSQSPRPQNSGDMMGGTNFPQNPMNVGMNAQGMGGPQTPVRRGSIGGGVMGGVGGTPGMNAGQQPHTPQQQQQLLQQQQQRQQAEQARQASLPPGASPMHQGGPVRASIPPAIPGPNITGPVARTPSTVAGTPVSGGPSGTGTGPSSNAGSVPPNAVSGGNALPAGGASSSATASSSTGPSSSANRASTTSSAIVPGQLPPLPANVHLNPATTQITPVPLIDSLKLIPPISESEITEIQGWMKKDKEYENVMRRMKERMNQEMRGLFGGNGNCWWEKGAKSEDVNRWRRGREMFDVRYPLRRGKEKEGRERRKRQREGLRLPRKLELEESERPEQLVPIRLEFDVEHHKMRDTFVWNLNDPVVTPETFAQSIVDDYGLAPNFLNVIVKQIQEQLNDFKAHSFNYDQDSGELVVDLQNEIPIIQGSLNNSQEKWWVSWRKRVSDSDFGIVGAGALAKSSSLKRSSKKKRKVDNPSANVVKMEEDEKSVSVTFADVSMEDEEFGKPMAIDEIKLDEELMHEEMRILIKLDVIVGAVRLEDQFEWDLENDAVTPEEFSEVYAQDLGLGGEFKTAIAHSIREQIHMFQKSLFLVGHPFDGTPIQDEELRQAFLPSLATGARSMDQVQIYTPLLNSVSDSDIERSEKEREKEVNKRRKRNQRGRRGIVAADREPTRTYRTPAIGFPELDPAILAAAAAQNAVGSRRAAAAAASLTIANMVASENGTAFVPTPTPLPSAPVPQPREKKPKGLFKAPNVPSGVLRPRAQVVAPTPSTAADVSKLPAPLENDPPPAIPPPPPPPEPKMKYVPKKSAKELEREAKEKEFVDGQHPNYINGVWHCSNCGCPENIAVGRRKGPLGDKSQCGTCGKFWHRHRRPRPVEYNPDPEYHMRKDSDSRQGKRKAAAQKAQTATAAATPVDISEPPTPAKNGDVDTLSRRSPSPMKEDDDRAISPVSTASSASEPPLAQKVKLNGASHAKSGTPRASTGAKETRGSVKPITPREKADTPLEKKSMTPKVKSENGQEASPPASTHAPNSTSEPVPPVVPQQVPTWLTGALHTMRSRYPDDRFEAILRRTTGNPPDWRIRCLDCPGKLYTPGPGESLSNYEVHLRNRQHRQRVNERINSRQNSS